MRRPPDEPCRPLNTQVIVGVPRPLKTAGTYHALVDPGAAGVLQGCGVDRVFIGVDFDSGVGIFMSTPTPAPTPVCLA